MEQTPAVVIASLGATNSELRKRVVALEGQLTEARQAEEQMFRLASAAADVSTRVQALWRAERALRAEAERKVARLEEELQVPATTHNGEQS